MYPKSTSPQYAITLITQSVNLVKTCLVFSDYPDYDNFYDDFLEELFDNDIPPPNSSNNPLNSYPLNTNPLPRNPINPYNPVKAFGVGNKSPTLRPRPGLPSQSADQRRNPVIKSPLGK